MDLTVTGDAEGRCPRCGRVYRRKRPARPVICECWRHCPACSPPYTVPMSPLSPDHSPSLYRGEVDRDIIGGSTETPGWRVTTLYVCLNHSPPLYSDNPPVEVELR